MSIDEKKEKSFNSFSLIQPYNIHLFYFELFIEFMIIAIKTIQQNKLSILYLVLSWDFKTSKDAIRYFFLL